MHCATVNLGDQGRLTTILTISISVIRDARKMNILVKPITVAHILSRLLEQLVVRTFLYSILTDSSFLMISKINVLSASCGSTTSALVNLTHLLSDLPHPSYMSISLLLTFNEPLTTVNGLESSFYSFGQGSSNYRMS